jgi:acetoin utilization deacetylase AcuC-like enzyme
MFRAYSSSAYTIELPDGHRFPMYKYAGTREKLVQDGVLQANAIVDPPRPSWEQIERVHTSEYLKKLRFGELEPKELRLLGFPWSSGLVERAMRAVGGTMAAAEDALRTGLGINLAGGTHHAFPAHGEGFCVLNDVAIAAMELLENALASRILVLDLDVHQGNGTATILNHDSRVFTLSVHGERNYPFHKERSSLDIGLGDGVTDAEYLDVLESRVLPILEVFRPEIVFYLAGVDVLTRDRFGRFALSLAGAKERDRRVFQSCRDLQIPVVSLMSGGYNKDHAVTVAGHANTVAAALEVYG